MMNSTNFNLAKRPGTLNMLVFGDCHLGNTLNKAHEMIVGLMSFLKDPKYARELDVILIEGDLFDANLMYNHEALPDIHGFMTWLIRKCVEHNIVLRILEGTPSHDNKQSNNFVSLIESMGVTIDFKYVADMMIEEHPILGTILYVPDEWSTSAEHTYESAAKLIASYGLEQVDFILMHGAFDHQLPPPHHIGDLWQPLVKYAIFVGHIHTPSIHGKIIASGSTDRCEHGNEEPKGASRVRIDHAGVHVSQFENIFAKKFITIDCRDLSVEETLAKVETYTSLPKGSFLRLHVKKTDNSSSALKFLAAEYPNFVWAPKIENDETEVFNTSGLLPMVNLTAMSVTKDNIQSVLLDYAATSCLEITASDLLAIKNRLGVLCSEN